MKHLLVVLGFGLLLSVTSVRAAVDGEATGSEVLTEVSDVIPPKGEKIAYTDPKSGEIAAIVTASSGDLDSGVSKKSDLSISPLVGGTGFSGRWNDHIGNQLSFGLAIEKSLSSHFGLELEALYARHQISYSNPYNLAQNIMHDFDQYQLGTNAKVYLLGASAFRPYVGAGLAGVYYTGLTRGFLNPNQVYSDFVGAGQLLAGADLQVVDSVSVGVKGSAVQPLWSRPDTLGNGAWSTPGFEEAAAVDSVYYRILGTVKVDL